MVPGAAAEVDGVLREGMLQSGLKQTYTWETCVKLVRLRNCSHLPITPAPRRSSRLFFEITASHWVYFHIPLKELRKMKPVIRYPRASKARGGRGKRTARK